MKYKPMLLRRGSHLWPATNHWVYEVKFDGYRMIGEVSRDRVMLFGKSGRRTYQDKYPRVAAALSEAIKAKNFIVDGELVAVDAEGRPQLSLLQQNLGSVHYYLFDILECDGKMLINQPLLERRRILEAVYQKNPIVHLSAIFDDMPALVQEVARRGLEGVVAKRKQSKYLPGQRSGSWWKYKIEY